MILWRTASPESTQACKVLEAPQLKQQLWMPMFTLQDFLHYRNLWSDTEQLKQKQILQIFAVSCFPRKPRWWQKILSKLPAWNSWKSSVLLQTLHVIPFLSDLPLHQILGRHQRCLMQSGKIFCSFIDVDTRKFLVDASLPQQLLPWL